MRSRIRYWLFFVSIGSDNIYFLKLFSASSEYFCKKNGTAIIVIGAAPALSLIFINRHG